MWTYEKKLQYPVKIARPNPALAKVVISQFGGPHGELGAANRYLSQRYVMPYGELKALLTDIGTEELGHIEMVCAIVYQLTRNLSEKEIKDSGFDTYFVDHTTSLYPIAASGVPFDASTFDSSGDVLTDLHEDMAAEQKARLTYDNILRLADDPDVRDAIKFLREREIVHFQRFGEGLRITQDHLNSANFYAFNPAFDKVKSAAPSNTPYIANVAGAGNMMGTPSVAGAMNVAGLQNTAGTGTLNTTTTPSITGASNAAGAANVVGAANALRTPYVAGATNISGTTNGMSMPSVAGASNVAGTTATTPKVPNVAGATNVSGATNGMSMPSVAGTSNAAGTARTPNAAGTTSTSGASNVAGAASNIFGIANMFGASNVFGTAPKPRY